MPAEDYVNGAVAWLWDMAVALDHRSPDGARPARDA